ncbi:MAG TPA: glycosyltransferase family 1 protein, partial [Thermoanaerobaculia bacterium]|nr:glycosyltransferase family 1 protein [Thermoanaerobaculia bacterium]
GKELQAVCEALEIEEIVEIGPPLPALPATPLRSLGELPAREVSAELQAARVGLLAYPPDYLGKSTIFAAYAAHGLLPVCLGRQGGGEPRPPFWLPGDSSAPGALQSLADAARSWYSSHTLPRQARELATLLSGGQAPR